MRFFRLLAVTAVAGLSLAGCATAQPPVSEKVEAAYEKGRVLTTPTASTQVAAAFLGDSFTAGNNDTPGEAKSSYMKRATDSLGIVGFNFGQGGTGYVNPGANESVVFAENVWRAVNVDPNVVIVGGGINDRTYPVAGVGAAAGKLYAELHAKLPKAKIIAVGPITPGGPGGYGNVEAVRDVLKAAAESHDVAFIDPIAEDWMPTKEGVTDSTKFHPNAKGQTLLAGKLTAALKALKLPSKKS